MKLSIYQINHDRDSKRVKFAHFDEINGNVDPAIYSKVFQGEIEEDSLEDVFFRFNIGEYHPCFNGHSLSVSDIVVNENGAFYCDWIGFKKISFDESMVDTSDLLSIFPNS